MQRPDAIEGLLVEYRIVYRLLNLAGLGLGRLGALLGSVEV